MVNVTDRSCRGVRLSLMPELPIYHDMHNLSAHTHTHTDRKSFYMPGLNTDAVSFDSEVPQAGTSKASAFYFYPPVPTMCRSSKGAALIWKLAGACALIILQMTCCLEQWCQSQFVMGHTGKGGSYHGPYVLVMGYSFQFYINI